MKTQIIAFLIFLPIPIKEIYLPSPSSEHTLIHILGTKHLALPHATHSDASV